MLGPGKARLEQWQYDPVNDGSELYLWNWGATPEMNHKSLNLGPRKWVQGSYSQILQEGGRNVVWDAGIVSQQQ